MLFFAVFEVSANPNPTPNPNPNPNPYPNPNPNPNVFEGVKRRLLALALM